MTDQHSIIQEILEKLSSLLKATECLSIYIGPSGVVYSITDASGFSAYGDEAVMTLTDRLVGR